MNAMDLFTAPLAQAIGWALLHLLWQATIVAGILAAVLALLRRHSANTRYAVSCSALALVFVMFVATAWRSYDPAPAPVSTKTTETEFVPITKAPIVLATEAAASWRERAMEMAASARQWLPIVVAIWLAGVVVLSSRLLVSWARTRRLASHGTAEASAQWQTIARRLSDALGLRRAVRLVESAAVEVPSVIGSLRPVILLPASALTGMTPDQIEMVLAHELAHIRRHDFFVNLLQAMVETLMFYHPAVWWMSRRVRVERENCCDDLAVAVCGNPVQYARALTRLEELRAHAPAISVAANGGSLLDRVRRLAAGRAESTGSSSRWAAAIAMLSVVIIALAVPSLPALADRDTAPPTPPAPPAPPAVQVQVVAPRPAPTAPPPARTPRPAPPAEPAEPADTEEPEDVDIDVDVEPVVAIAPVAIVSPAPPVVTPAPTPPAPPMQLAVMEALEHLQDAPGRPARTRNKKFGTSGKLTVDELIQLRAVGVTPEYIEQMRSVLPSVPLGDVVSLRTMGVKADYVKAMRAAGVDVKTAREVTQLKAMNVTPEFVKKLADAGYANLSVGELTRLAAAGIDGDFIREMSKYRDKN